MEKKLQEPAFIWFDEAAEITEEQCINQKEGKPTWKKNFC